MEKYEITYLCEEGKPVDVKKALEENQAKIEKETDLGIRGLAYPIGKVTKARYLAIRFELEPSELIRIEKTLRLNKEIVRYLIVKNPPEAPIKTIKAPETKVEAPKPLPTAVPPKEKGEIEKKPQPQPKADLPLAEETKKTIIEPVKEVKTVQAKPEAKTEETPLAEKTEATEEKQAKKIKKDEKKTPPKEKPVRISKEKLDEKLKELTID